MIIFVVMIHILTMNTKKALPSPVATAERAKKTIKDRKVLKEDGEKRNYHGRNGKEEDQDYSLCVSFYLRGINRSRVSVLTSLVTQTHTHCIKCPFCSLIECMSLSISI